VSDRSDFLVAIKSTLDKQGAEIASAIGVKKYVDLDDQVNTTKALTGPDDVVMWRLLTVDDDPVDPLYRATFVMGIKTSSDPSNYRLLKFSGEVGDRFPVGGSLFVRDWSNRVAPTQEAGRLFFVSSGVDTQSMEVDAGFRLLPVTAMAQRFV